MNRVVAVENNLNPVRDFLTAQGCQIIAVEKVKDTRVDAVVLSSVDQNVMGIQDTTHHQGTSYRCPGEEP